jgi:hypothetical protein
MNSAPQVGASATRASRECYNRSGEQVSHWSGLRESSAVGSGTGPIFVDASDGTFIGASIVRSRETEASAQITFRQSSRIPCR